MTPVIRRMIVIVATLAVVAAASVALSPDARRFVQRQADRVAYHFWNVVDPPVSPTQIWEQLADPASAITLDINGGGGAVAAIVFIDYNCIHCRRQFRELDAVAGDGPRLRIVLRHKLYTPESIPLAKAMLAARRQNGHHALHRVLAAAEGRLGASDLPRLAAAAGLDFDRLQADLEQPEIQAQIDADMRMAWRMRIKGTPTMVTAAGEIFRGVQAQETLAALEGAKPH